jgi:hypothetical protein
MFTSYNKWLFKWNDKREFIYVSYYSVWQYFEKILGLNGTIINNLIESWLKEYTDWPTFPTFCDEPHVSIG